MSNQADDGSAVDRNTPSSCISLTLRNVLDRSSNAPQVGSSLPFLDRVASKLSLAMITFTFDALS